MDEKRIKYLMDTLLCTREEAISVIEDDKKIDQGQKLFEFETKEQKQAAKQATITTSNDISTKKERKPKEKKANEDKAFIIKTLISSLANEITNLDVSNEEREFTFSYHNTKYKIVLSAPRS